MDKEQNQQRRQSIFTPYSSSDPTLNVPVTSGQAGVMSPYMNFDPQFIKTGEAEFIFPEGASSQRGRFELAFFQIGTSVIVGGSFGAVQGMTNWVKEYANRTDLPKGVKGTQMLNMVGKKSAVHAQTLGTIAVIYSGLGWLISKGGVEGETNTLSSATVTGMLYKSSGGLKECMRGGAVGLGLGLVYCLWNSKDKLRYMFNK